MRPILYTAALSAILTFAILGCRNEPVAGNSTPLSGTAPTPLIRTKTVLETLAPKARLTVTSPDITANAPIPERFANYDANETPTIRWSKPPEGTKSLVVLVEDPSAPGDAPFVHWFVYNLPADADGVGAKVPAGAQTGTNSANKTAYFGPRPPQGDPPHVYCFEVFALNRTLDLKPGADRAAFQAAIPGALVAAGELRATFGK